MRLSNWVVNGKAAGYDGCIVLQKMRDYDLAVDVPDSGATPLPSFRGELFKVVE
jgi:hypothetical protein